MRNLFLKVISIAAIIMLVATVGITVSAYEYPDEGYWANEAIDAAIDNGLLRGKDDGKMHSEDNLTRAEMAAIMVRSFGATIEADISEYKDLSPSAWYYKDFAKAVQMKVFEGDGTGNMRPNDYITREEVFTVVARALVLNDTNYSTLNKFNDADKISSWAKGYMSILTKKSYVNGDDLGNCNPKKNITRAEFAQLMHNIFRNYYSKADTYTGNTDSRSSMINVGNVTFKNVTVNGDLVIGDGNAQGTIRLENVNVKGRLLVRGANRVELVNTTVGEMVVVNNYNTVVHFDNYRDEKVFDGIILNTEATFKEKAVTPTPGGSVGGGGGGGGTTTSYTVTYDEDGGSNVPNGKAYKNRAFTLPGANSTTKTGHVLKGWIVNGVEYAPGASVTGITSSITVKAVWELATYTITYDTDGGSAISAGTLTYGYALTLPGADSTFKNGYKLTGWMVNGTEYAPGAAVSGISADTTVKAIWTDVEFTVTFDTDGGSSIANGTAILGEGFVLPGNNATSKNGYYLKGWEVNGTEYAPGATVLGITADTTIKALWEAVTPGTKYGSYVVKHYKQNTDLATYTLISADDIVVNNVVVGSFTYTSEKTYTGFKLNANSLSITKNITENGTTVFEVYYDRESYTVIYDENGGTSINNGTAYYGVDFTLPAVGTTTKTGYTLTGWTVNGTEYAPGTTVTGITANTTATAVWTANTYTVTFDTNGGTAIANGTATYGQGFTLPADGATTKTGYKLTGWIVNGITYNPGATVTGITANTTAKAVWTAETYTITYDVNGGTPISNGTATYGQEFTLPDANSTTKTGYTLTGWTVNGTDYAPGTNVSGINANTTIKAVWTAETYTITYDVDGGSMIAPTTVTYGDELTLPAVGSTTKTGYVLAGWNVGGTKYAPGASVSGISADTTIKAVWELETYTVTYDTDGGTAIDEEEAKYGEGFVLPGSDSTTKTGYYLKGWIVNGVQYLPGATVTGINADTTAKAVWEEITPDTKYGSYTVKNYKQNEDLTTYQYAASDDLVFNNAPVGMYGYRPADNRYEGFELNGNSVSITFNVVENEMTIVNVYYDRKTYTVTYNVDGGTAMSEGTAYYGIDFTLPGIGSTTKTGWTLKGWEVFGTNYALGERVSGITMDTTAKAIWERETYTVTYDVDGGTPVASGTATFGYGFTLPGSDATTKTGYTLVGWEVNGRTYNPGTTASGIAADTTVKAVWEVITYEITYNVDGGSAIAPTTVEYGKTLTLPAVGSTTKTGYTLVGWMVKGTQYNPGATVSDITADTEVLAVWKLDEYTITYDVDGGSAIADGKAYYGVDFTLPSANATTKTGYTLVGWEIDGTSYSFGATVSGIVADTTVKAVWEINTFTVTYNTVGGSTIAPVTVNYGDDLVLPGDGSTTKTGYILKGWNINGTQYDLGATVSNITANVIVMAVWEAETYTVTYDTDGGTAIAPATVAYGEALTLPAVGSTTKDGYKLTGWMVNGTKYNPGAAVTGITDDTTVTAVWEVETPGTQYGSYVIKYYKQNTEGQYDYVAGDDETGTVEVGSYTITVNSTKYEGYILNASNVYTMDIVEGQTTEFKVYYDIKPSGVEYNTVTFYYRTNAVGTAEVEKGTTVSEAQFPDYMKTYKDGYVKDSTVSPVYTEPYQHTVDYGWWFNPESDKWEEFTPETVVNSDMDVYLKIQKFNTIVTLANGEQFNFYAFYESDTRFTDTVKDLLYKRGPLEALKVSGYMDKVREKGITQKVLDTDDNIMMLSYMIKFSTILGEENMEEFIVDNAKEMFASGNNATLHNAFVEYIIAVSNSTDPAEKQKVHDLMESTINHVFEEDEISQETLDLIRDLCNDALSDPEAFKEITGYEYSSLPADTKTFVVNYIIDQLVNDDELFAEVVKEVTGVDYTSATTTKDLIIAMAEKQLDESFDSTIDSIKDSQKTLIVATVESMLNDSSNGLYDEVLTYAVENEKATIVATIKTLLETEGGLYDEVVNFIVGDATYKPMLTGTVSALLTDSTSTMYDDVMNIVADSDEYRAIVAEEIGNKLATDDELFEALTGYDPAVVPDRAAAISDLKDEITNNKSSFEAAIADAEAAGYKTFITDSIIDELETNDTFFSSVFAEAKNSYRSEIVDTVSDELGKTGNEDLLDDVVGYAKDDYKSTIVGVIVDELNEDNSPMYTKVIELAKTDAYKATIKNAVVNEMNGTNGNSMIIAITGVTDTELAKDPQDKDGYIMSKAEELLNGDYFDTVIESVTGDPDYVLPATPKDFIIDMVVIELMDTEANSPTRDLIIEEAIEYLLEAEDEDEIGHLADYAIEYLGKHPDERDALVDEIIEGVYREALDKLVYQLINEDQFEVHADTVFVAEGLKSVLLEDYNYETFFGSKVPEKLERVFEIYPEEKLIELYNFALNSLIDQIDVAIADALAGETGYVDTGITPVVNIIDDIYVPLYETYKKIMEGKVDDKIGDNFYYAENIYLQELLKLLDPTVWVQGSANAKPSETTGYKIYDIDYYYDLYYKIYVLSDDTIMWYHENLVEPKYEEVMEKYQDVILKYVNVMADKIDIYVVDGEIPKVNEKVDDKISAAEKAIVEKYPELVKGMLDKYKGTDFFNKDYTEVDYDKVKDKVYDMYVRTLNLTTDEYFDIILNQEAYEKIEDKVEDKAEDLLDGKLDGEYYTKIDDNTYEFEVNDYMIRFIREFKNTLY